MGHFKNPFVLVGSFVLGLHTIGLLISKVQCEDSSTPIPKKIVYIKLGEHCRFGSPPGDKGSWEVDKKNVEKVCPSEISSCRNGACNCDNLPDGTVMSISTDSSGGKSCRRVAGQNCSVDKDCFDGVSCENGVCTCDLSKPKVKCVDRKTDVIMLD